MLYEHSVGFAGNVSYRFISFFIFLTLFAYLFIHSFIQKKIIIHSSLIPMVLSLPDQIPLLAFHFSYHFFGSSFHGLSFPGQRGRCLFRRGAHGVVASSIPSRDLACDPTISTSIVSRITNHHLFVRTRLACPSLATRSGLRHLTSSPLHLVMRARSTAPY